MQQLFFTNGATVTITNERRELSERLRELVRKVFPTSGRFPALEEASGISASRWKNFFYRKQEAADDMVEFWGKKYPNNQQYLLTGIYRPEDDEFPFGTKAPIRWEGQTVGDRLVWVISEWAAPKGDGLFSYLEEKSNGKISASSWARVIMRAEEPTIEMLAIVCSYRPHFSEWLITGRTAGMPSVDPTSKESVKQWKEWDATRFGALSGFPQSSKSVSPTKP